MKQTSEFVVIRNKETGLFLKSFCDRTTLAFEGEYADSLQCGLRMPVEYYEKQKHDIKCLAKIANGEIVKVKAKYTLTYPNGEELREIQPKRDDFNEMMNAMLKDVLGGE